MLSKKKKYHAQGQQKNKTITVDMKKCEYCNTKDDHKMEA